MNKFLNDINEVFVIKIFKKLGRCEALSSALIQFLLGVHIKSFLCFFKSVVNNLIKKCLVGLNNCIVESRRYSICTVKSEIHELSICLLAYSKT